MMALHKAFCTNYGACLMIALVSILAIVAAAGHSTKEAGSNANEVRVEVDPIDLGKKKAEPSLHEEGKLEPKGHHCIHDELVKLVGYHDVRAPQRYRSGRGKQGSDVDDARHDRKLEISKSSFEKMRITVDWSLVDDPGQDKNDQGNHLACTGSNSNYINMDGHSRSCSSSDVMSSTQKEFLKDLMEEDAAKFFEDTLSVDPVDGNLELGNGLHCSSPAYFICCSSLLPSDHKSPGVEDTDFLVYATARPTGGSILAWAIICQSDQHGRPIAAQVNFNPSGVDPQSNRDETVMTARHELTHGLGFTQTKFYQLGIIDEFNINGKTVRRIISPKVAEVAESFYDCPDWGSAAGGEIEDGGGTGTAGSHWEKRVLSDEYMTGRSERDTVVSAFTLALFEDTGWYLVDYDKAQGLSWGEGQGCGFVDETCDRWNSRYFCEQQNRQGCTINFKARARCNLRDYSSALPSHFQYFSNPDLGGRDSLADYCPYFAPSSGGFCDDDDTSTAWFYGEQVGPSSMCFVGTWRFKDSSGDSRHNGCLRTRCDLMTQRVIVELDADALDHEEFFCPLAGGSVDLLEVTDQYKGFVECPDASVRCTGDPCDNNDCNGHGTCISGNGTCSCNDGFYGSDEFSCNKQLCPNQEAPGDEACSGHGTCEPATGECDCDMGYTEDDCSRQGCPTGNGNCTNESPCECSGQGSCSDTGECDCADGWRGDACDKKECPTSRDSDGDVKECGGSSRGKCNTDYGICECFDELETVNGTRHYAGLACADEGVGRRPRKTLYYFGEPIDGNISNVGDILEDSITESSFNHYQFAVPTTEIPVDLDVQIVNSETVSTSAKESVKIFAMFEEDGDPTIRDHQFSPSTSDIDKGLWRIRFEDSDSEQGDFSSAGTMLVNVLSIESSISYTLNLTRDGCALLTCHHEAECSSSTCQCSRWPEPNNKDRTYGYTGSDCSIPDCPGQPDCGGSRGTCKAPPKDSSDPPWCECTDDFQGNACEDYSVTSETLVPGSISSGRDDAVTKESTDRLKNKYAGVDSSSSDTNVTRKTVSFTVVDTLPIAKWHFPLLIDAEIIREVYNLTGTLGIYVRLNTTLTPLADPMLFTREDVRPNLRDYAEFDTRSWTEERDFHEISATLPPSNIYFVGVFNGNYGRDILKYVTDVEISNGCPPSLESCSFHGKCDVDSKTCSCDEGWNGIKCDIPVTELMAGSKIITDMIPKGAWRYFVLPLNSETKEVEVNMKDDSPSRRAQAVVVAAFDRTRRRTSLNRLKNANALYDFDGYTRVARGSARRRSRGNGDANSEQEQDADAAQRMLIRRESSSSEQFLYVGIQNVPQAGAKARVELEVITRNSFSVPADCADDCGSKYCRGRGQYVLSSGVPLCRCDNGWSGTSWCASPSFSSFQSLPQAAQSVSFLCSLCQDDVLLERGDMKLYRISQSLQSHIALKITAKAFDGGTNETSANPAVLASQILPRTVVDFAFISSSNAVEETLSLSELSVTGSYFVGLFAHTSAHYAVGNRREKLFEPEDPSGRLGDEVGNWLVNTSAGNLTLAFLCILVSLILACVCFNRLCKHRMIRHVMAKNNAGAIQDNSNETQVAEDENEEVESKKPQIARPSHPPLSSRDMLKPRTHELKIYKSHRALNNAPSVTMPSAEIPKPPR